MHTSVPSRRARAAASVSAVALALVLGGAFPAFAQSAPAQKPATKDSKDKATEVEAVTVTGDNTRTRTSIDRRSYDITKDLQATTGSIADALRSVPSVQVDMDGNVSVRGDGNVTIWVDGKPSSMFQGAAGQALQTIPANQFERVEVITNPSAASAPDGSAGIINLVSKKTTKPGSFGSIRVAADPLGRVNAGINYNRRQGKWTVALTGHTMRNVMETDTVGQSTSFDAFGTPTLVVSTKGNRDGEGMGGFGRAAVDYDLDKNTRISGSIRAVKFTNPGDVVSLRTAATPTGTITSITEREGSADFGFSDIGADTTYRRNFEGEQHDFVLRMAYGRQTQDNESASVTRSLQPVSPDVYDRRDNQNVVRLGTINADYQKPFGENARLKLGYEGRFENNSYATAGFVGQASPNAPNSPGQTNLFEAERNINAVYATFEQTIGKFTWLGGLRYETSDFQLNQVTSGLTSERTEDRLYPTLHLGWELDDKDKLVFSYSQRIQRPDPQQFNPFVVIFSPYALSTGNPNLDPQTTDSFELRFDRQEAKRTYSATVFHRINDAGVATETIDIGGGVFLSRPVNMTSSTATGLELSGGGKLGTDFTFNISGDASWVEVDALPTLGATARSGWVVNGNASLNWQATPKDLLQFNVSSRGGQISPLQDTDSIVIMNLGYRHKINDKLFFIATARDLNAGFKMRTMVDTARVRSFNENFNKGRTLFLGFQYNFGAGPRRDNPQFDFGNGPGG
jgi:outer membrane receptor protein involved in Fe transport